MDHAPTATARTSRANRGTRSPTPTQRFISTRQVALETGWPYCSVRDLVLRGELPVVRLGRRWWHAREDVERLIVVKKEVRGSRIPVASATALAEQMKQGADTVVTA